MAISLRKVGATTEFRSEFDDAPKDKQTVFHIRSLKSSELAYLNDRIATMELSQGGEKLNRKERRKRQKEGGSSGNTSETRMNLFNVSLEAVQGAVSKIERLDDGSGSLINVTASADGHFAGNPCKVLPDAIMDAFDTDVAAEIFEHILDQENVSEDDAKNS